MGLFTTWINNRLKPLLLHQKQNLKVKSFYSEGTSNGLKTIVITSAMKNNKIFTMVVFDGIVQKEGASYNFVNNSIQFTTSYSVNYEITILYTNA